MDSRFSVVLPFIRASADQNPNVSARGADPYDEAIVVTLASVQRFNPSAELVLATNVPPTKRLKNDLRNLGVFVELVEFSHEPPEDFTDRYAASLYLLDVLAALNRRMMIFIDPDVLCIRNLNGMLDDIEGKVGALPIDYAPDHVVNGLSRRQAGELHALLGEPEGVPIHFGGEIYVFPQEFVGALCARSEIAWAFALERHAGGLRKFVTEEHVLSFALRGVPVASLSAHARRIWTARKYRTVDGRERELSLWHVPAEKSRGFRELYPAVVEPGSWFWASTDEEFVKRCASHLGISGRRLSRLAADTLGQAVHAARHLPVVRRGKPVFRPRSSPRL